MLSAKRLSRQCKGSTLRSGTNSCQSLRWSGTHCSPCATIYPMGRLVPSFGDMLNKLTIMKIRRLQLKFASGQDFESACHHLRLLGLRMSSSEQRPSIGSASSPTTPTNNASLSCPPERLAELYNRPRTTGTSVSSASSSNAPRLSSPLARHSFTSASHVQEPTAAIRPISASSETIWAGMGSNHTMTPTVQSDPLVPPVYFQRPNSSSSTLDRPSSSITAERERLTTLPTINGDSASSILRPESSDLRTHHNLPSLLPPRRELPFARSTPPKSSGSDTIRASSRSLSGSMRPPPIPASSPRLSRMSSVEQLARGEPTTPRIVQPTFDANIMHMSRPASSPSPRTSVVTDPPPLPKPTFVDDARKSACAASSPPIYCTSNTSDNQNATPLRQISISAQNTFPSTPCALSPTLAQSEASYQDRILPELFYNAHANENLASYSMRPQEDRMAILNDFMMQQIDDDNFINLVEDVSVCWARIGLGLG